jgi:DNA adenine methylase
MQQTNSQHNRRRSAKGSRTVPKTAVADQQEIVSKQVLLSRKKQSPSQRSEHSVLSPFRYPGGKSWFLKTVRMWLRNQPRHSIILVEPFAGGASVSLAAVYENLVKESHFAERDRNVAAIWKTILNGEAKWLADKIRSFSISRRRVKEVLARNPSSLRKLAFQCLLRNRTARGGVITNGAGLIRKGENGKGLRSRWYPETLAKRILAISSLRSKLKFTCGDGFEMIRKFIHRKNAVFFVDPPYTKAAHRLYRYWDIDHEELFRLLSRAKGDVLMTYDDTAEIRSLANKYGFKFQPILMQTSHHQKKRELMISWSFDWQKP